MNIGQEKHGLPLHYFFMLGSIKKLIMLLITISFLIPTLINMRVKFMIMLNGHLNRFFYANFTSKTNQKTAPPGCENGFFLIPIATNIKDCEEIRAKYFDKIILRLEELSGEKLKKHILFKESFCVNDFIDQYNSYGGNAYGLANTLTQTAFLRPNLKSNKVKNLYFSGQLTVPGPGVPPAIVSGKLVSDLIISNEKTI